MTVKEAAQLLAKSETTIRRWIKQGKLDAVMISGRYDIEESSLEKHKNPNNCMDDAPENNKSTEYESQLEDVEKLVKQDIEPTKPWTAQNTDIGTYTRRYMNGEVILEKGSTGKEVYFIVSGMVEISYRIGKRKMILVELKEGDFFGEMATLTGRKRSMTGSAIGDVYLWKLSPDEMRQYLQHNPQFTMDLCIKLAERLDYTDLLLGHLAMKTLNGSEEDKSEIIDYLWKELKEKNNEIKELRRKVKPPEKSSLFLRGLERGRKRKTDLLYVENLAMD